jgi:hypothetical protein
MLTDPTSFLLVPTMYEKFTQPRFWGIAPSATELDTPPHVAFDESNHATIAKRSDTTALNVQHLIEIYCDTIQVSNVAAYATHQDMKRNNVISCRFHSNPSHPVDYPHSSLKTFTTPELSISNLGFLNDSRGVMLQTFLITNYFYYQSYLLSLTQGPTIFTCYLLSLTELSLLSSLSTQPYDKETL